MQRVPITKRGLEDLKKELRRLKTVERTKVIKELEMARSLGDISENAEYNAAKEHQALIERKINEMEDKIARSRVIDTSRLSGERVVFGASVRLRDVNTMEAKTFTLVGEYESNTDKGLISVTSPVGKALVGKEVDDEVEVFTPSGKRKYLIEEVGFR